MKINKITGMAVAATEQNSETKMETFSTTKILINKMNCLNRLQETTANGKPTHKGKLNKYENTDEQQRR